MLFLDRTFQHRKIGIETFQRTQLLIGKDVFAPPVPNLGVMLDDRADEIVLAFEEVVERSLGTSALARIGPIPTPS